MYYILRVNYIYILHYYTVKKNYFIKNETYYVYINHIKNKRSKLLIEISH